MARTAKPKFIDPLSLPPTPAEAELSEEQQKIKELEHKLAVAEGKKEVEIEFDSTEAEDESEEILFHIVEDGFTALGQQWFRGQEIRIVRGSPAYKLTLDRNGHSFLDDFEGDYLTRGDKVVAIKGPWRGKKLTDITEKDFTVVAGEGGKTKTSFDPVALARAAEAEIVRNQRPSII